MNSKPSRIILILLLSLTWQKVRAQDSLLRETQITETFKVLEISNQDVARKEFSYIHYPIFTYGNQKVDSLINGDIQNTLFRDHLETSDIDLLLKNWANESLSSLDFKITYQSQEFLSFQIEIEACTAYCSYWVEYFNYSLTSGEPLTLQEVVDTTGRFKELVFHKKDIEYNRQRRELKALFDDSSEEDSASLEWALQLYESCQEAFKMERFALYPKHIELIELCEFPHFIRNYGPFIELKFQYDGIEEYLKTKM